VTSGAAAEKIFQGKVDVIIDGGGLLAVAGTVPPRATRLEKAP
jgi:hypothetical protein